MLPTGSEDLEPTACLELMLAGFERAARAATRIVTRYVRFGGSIVALRFAGDALVEKFEPVLAHLFVEMESAPDFTVNLWDSESTGQSVSPLIQFMRSRIAYNHFEFLTPRHEIIGISNDRVPATLDQWSGAFSLYDRESRVGVYWVESADEIPYFERAAPLRTILSWGLSDLGYQSVHAAGVGDPDGGVLLAGRGGSGKSSTALLCLESGMGHLADDYCLINSSEPFEAFSMYSVAKLDGLADLQRMPSFLPHIVNPESVGEEKLMMHLHSHFADQLVTSFPIRAVVVPTVTGRPESSLAPISAASALRALGPTTLLQRPGSGSDAMRTMSALVRNVPSFELALGSDRERIPALIEDLLSE